MTVISLLYFLLDFSQHIRDGFYIVVTSLITCFILYPGTFFSVKIILVNLVLISRSVFQFACDELVVYHNKD